MTKKTKAPSAWDTMRDELIDTISSNAAENTVCKTLGVSKHLNTSHEQIVLDILDKEGNVPESLADLLKASNSLADAIFLVYGYGGEVGLMTGEIKARKEAIDDIIKNMPKSLQQPDNETP